MRISIFNKMCKDQIRIFRWKQPSWFYCFFHRHLCDGMRQCVGGEDENVAFCKRYNCTGLFRCVLDSKQKCLHPAEVCDGANDCLSGEDESLCELQTQCPANCYCLMYAVACKNNTQVTALQLIKVQAFFNHYVSVTFHKITLQRRDRILLGNSLISLSWTQSKLVDICYLVVFSSKTLQLLYLSHNNISTIERNCLICYNLKVLFLNNNELSHIKQNAILEVNFLLKLDISCNNLHELFNGPLWFPQIHTLNLSGNSFYGIDQQFGENLVVTLVLTEDYRLCCFLESHITCTGQPVWPSNCSRILPSFALYILCIVCCCLILVLNILAILFEQFPNILTIFIFMSTVNSSKQSKKGKAFSSVVLCLNCNDTLFGLYLSALLIVHVHFGNKYILNSTEWLSSVSCFVLAVLSACTILDSLFLLNFISFARLAVVKYPFGSFFKEKEKVVCAIVAGFVTNILLSLVALFSFKVIENGQQMPSGVCWFLGQTTTSCTVEIFTILVASLQIVSLAHVCVCHSVLVFELGKAKMEVSTKTKDQKIGIQLFIITVVNALCWLQSCAIYFISLTMETFSIDLLIWNVVVITPLNAVINPLIFSGYPLVKRHLSEKSSLNLHESCSQNIRTHC